MTDLGGRIMVMGSSGSGKSTLAMRLGGITGLPVVHIDCLFWKPGWVESPKDELDAKVRAAADGPAWIIDGHFKRTLGYRLERADTVIFLDFNRCVCLWRVLKRWMKYYGKSRPDMTQGCHEKIDLPFLKWIWDYSKNVRVDTLAWLAEIQPPKRVVILKGNRAVKGFLAGVSESKEI